MNLASKLCYKERSYLVRKLIFQKNNFCLFLLSAVPNSKISVMNTHSGLIAEPTEVKRHHSWIERCRSKYNWVIADYK